MIPLGTQELLKHHLTHTEVFQIKIFKKKVAKHQLSTKKSSRVA